MSKPRDNCPNFIKNLNYFSTTHVQFLINSSLSLKELSFNFRMMSSCAQDYTGNNLMGFIIFPDNYCYFLRYLCHLRLGNIQRSIGEFSEIERMKCIGSEHEKIMHRLTMSKMKLITLFEMNQKSSRMGKRDSKFYSSHREHVTEHVTGRYF